MMVLAVTRVPGLLPENFSAVYAIMFCAGVFIPGRTAWWVPLVTLLVTDIALNVYYWWFLKIDTFTAATLLYLGINYAVYPLLILLGRKCTAKASWLSLLGGGILGALLFYFITNTASWFLNPFGNLEYSKTLEGWIRALTLGTSGWPQTWEFFRNTLMSGGLFTGLFAGAMKLSESAQEKEARENEPEDAEENEPEAEEAKA
jgi:hypothetical protein